MSKNDERILRAWMDRTETSEEALSAQIIERGGKASPKYVENVANELMEPGWHLCEILEKITGLDARAIKNRPYKRAA